MVEDGCVKRDPAEKMQSKQLRTGQLASTELTDLAYLPRDLSRLSNRYLAY